MATRHRGASKPRRGGVPVRAADGMVNAELATSDAWDQVAEQRRQVKDAQASVLEVVVMDNVPANPAQSVESVRLDAGQLSRAATAYLLRMTGLRPVTSDSPTSENSPEQLS